MSEYLNGLRTVCNICRWDSKTVPIPESARVASNVRVFRHEQFTVWRCEKCKSVHSYNQIDLNRYYEAYPYQRHKSNLGWRLMHYSQISRLKRAGLRREHSILDYGCGNGVFLDSLRRKGYTHVYGYDRYSSQYNDAAALKRQYNCVVLQDVVEHVEDTRALIADIAGMTAPGGWVCIGTPNADNINLREAFRHIHPLHQPYHLHILSSQALMELAAEFDLKIVRSYKTAYNTPFPAMNLRFARYYCEAHDNTLDLGFEGLRFSFRLLTPWSLWLAVFGSLMPPNSETLIIFQRTG